MAITILRVAGVVLLAVALSAVITDNVEDEAIRRYGARAESEAQGATGAPPSASPSPICSTTSSTASSGGSWAARWAAVRARPWRRS